MKFFPSVALLTLSRLILWSYDLMAFDLKSCDPMTVNRLHRSSYNTNVYGKVMGYL